MYLTCILKPCFNSRLDQNKVAINDRKDDNWGTEVVQPLIVMQQDSAVKVFNPGLTAQILIESEAAHLKVSEHEIVLIMKFLGLSSL